MLQAVLIMIATCDTCATLCLARALHQPKKLAK